MLRARLLAFLREIRKDADATELMRRYVASSDLTDLREFLGTESHILAVGKAASSMYQGLVSKVSCRRSKVLVLRAKGNPCRPLSHRAFHQSCCDHPLPTDRNVHAAASVERFVNGIPESGSLLVLLSGGASAFLSLPGPGLDLEMLRSLTEALQRAGATIHEINTVRMQIERLKGGRLGGMCHAKQVRVVVLSDVLGDKIEVIGSGPFAIQTSTPRDALSVLRKYDLVSSHASAAAYLRKLSGQPSLMHQARRIRHEVIGSNRMLVNAIVSRCVAKKISIHRVEHGYTGHADQLGERVARCIFSDAYRDGVCIFGGEPTVNVKDATGHGGPSMEVALKTAILGAGHPEWALLAYSTDGRDGPTIGAGAIVHGQTVQVMKSRGVDPLQALKNHDSFRAHQRGGTLIKTGATGTNVNHIYVLLRT